MKIGILEGIGEESSRWYFEKVLNSDNHYRVTQQQTDEMINQITENEVSNTQILVR